MHLGSKSSMEYREYFYFEMFFLNSKFHEICELGAIITYKEGEEGVMSCISVLNCSMMDQEYFLLRNILPKLEIPRNTSIGGLFSSTGEPSRGKSAAPWF